MDITSAQYIRNRDDTDNIAIIATVDDETIEVPINLSNRHYAEIKRQVDAGELTIEDAE
tara:strand:+ start:2800 stop:2976 length:177 start_codon:yes stop_codon:yes gene_type:complete